MSLIFTCGFEGVDLASIHEFATNDVGGNGWMTARDPSFDTGATSGLYYNTQFGASEQCELARAEGRQGGDAFRMMFDMWYGQSFRIIPGVYFDDEVYFGFAYKFDEQATYTEPERINIYFLHTNGSSEYYTLRLQFNRTETGWDVTPSTANGAGGYPVMSTESLVDRPLDGWRYIQIGIKWSTAISDPADGTIEVRSIGDSVSWTTCYSAPSYASGMSGMHVYKAMIAPTTTQSAHVTCNMLLDDMYMCTNAGSGPANTFLGAVRIKTLYPSSDVVDNNDWTPSGGGSHCLGVDEAYVAFDSGTYNTAGDDGDEDYVETNEDEALELYEFDEIDISGVGYSANILGVSLNILARPVIDDGVETHLTAISMKSGEALQDHDDLGAVEDDSDRRIAYGWYRQYLDEDPITSSAFTEDGLNQTRFGFRNDEQLA